MHPTARGYERSPGDGGEGTKVPARCVRVDGRPDVWDGALQVLRQRG